MYGRKKKRSHSKGAKSIFNTPLGKHHSQLKRHGKHHSNAHMKIMTNLMRHGTSFTKAHRAAQKMVGK